MESSGNQTRKVKRTQAVSDAQKRYYEKNREARLQQMRERAKTRNEAQKQIYAQDPNALKEAREKMMEKYYKYVESKNNRQVAEWLKSEDETIKKFVASYITPNRHTIPRSIYVALDKLIKETKQKVDGGAEIPDINFC